MKDFQTKRTKKRFDIRIVIRKILSKPFTTVFRIVIVVSLLNILYPKSGVFFTSMREGDIAQQDIVAPFTFPIQKDPDEIKKERRRAVESVLPVVDYDEEKTAKIIKEINSFFAALYKKGGGNLNDKVRFLNEKGYHISKNTVMFLLKPDIKKNKEKLKDILLKPIKKGIIYDKNEVLYMKEKRISLRKASGETICATKDFYSLEEAKGFVKDKAFSSIKKNEEIIKAMDEVIALFYSANLRINIEETERRRKEASASVSETKGLVLKGEMIVRAHDQITKEIALKLNSLNKILGRKKSIFENILLRIGLNIILFLLLFFFYFYIFRYEYWLWKKRENMLVIEITILLFLYLTSFLFKLEHVFLFLIPISFLSMVFTMFSGEILSMVISFTLASIIAIFLGMRFPIFIFLMVSSIAGIFSVRGIKRRAKLYKTVLIISAANVLLVFGLESFSRTSFFNMLMGTSFGVINAVASVFLMSILLPLYEKLTGTTTNITLFELSDLNLPLLKKLSVTAPGTYNHSIIVGNLAEAAAEAIGANSILTRVSSYYHDIGKMGKPEYFIENQMGLKNPHAKLTPQLSCIILISHVKEGVEIAQKARLPYEIIRIIKEHHGTSLIIPFFEKAKKQKHKGKLDESQFRYPGPLPSSKESGIVMLADSVEAASRSLEEPNAKKLKSLIKEIIEDRFQEGQLNNSQLTLTNLSKIGESFLPILIGMHHLRVEYPKKFNQSATKPQSHKEKL